MYLHVHLNLAGSQSQIPVQPQVERQNHVMILGEQFDLLRIYMQLALVGSWCCNQWAEL